ncbi:MAG: cyclopropane-fatty-acyl-phospholipid synthase family protein [Desulfobacteraceae bacterium]|nr:cyclopropane-fatty-acyl-phospholipid synthase family protein [Desulfobacteraceae bacterium]
MPTTIVPASTADSRKTGGRAASSLARKLVRAQLRTIRTGRLSLQEGGRRQTFGRPTEDFPLEAVIDVRDPGFFSKTAFGGDLGAAEAYMAGYWTTDDLTAAIRIVLHNQIASGAVQGRLARWAAPAHLLFHILRKNTPGRSRENIVAHYDLGNDFYRLFLDETLTYSCGIFETDASTLVEASRAKYDRICRKLRLGPDDDVLEIGTGWGGFALHAASRYGCRVTTTTISDRQHALASERIRDARLDQRITLLKKDYRSLRGTFDKVVSIEMIEAVGHHYLEVFFGVCSDRLKPDGTMLLQAITMADHTFEQHKSAVDFIKRYIFPGSCIPSVTAMCRAMSRKTDLRLVHLEDITPHYATTLRTWRENFLARIEAVRSMGFPEPFIRMWEYYFCYCEAGFAERYLGDVQMLLAKPLNRRQPLLPELP